MADEGRIDFDDFFTRAADRPPFPYQRAFATAPDLPDVLRAPTGAGKTATAVLGWLWRRLHGPATVRQATPRRLVFCLPMRTLVDQTERVVRDRWLPRLDLVDTVGVHALLGGAIDNDWDAHPEREAILVGTQDQLLSRALNRGYGMSRFRWPVHFGLLNNDCLWVVDEVQLMGPGLSTSTQLQAFRERMKTTAPTRSIWMSATLDAATLATVDFAPRAGSLAALELGEADRRTPDLAARLGASKSLTRATVALTPGGGEDYARALAAEVLAAHAPGTLTLVVLNRVARAQALYRALAVLSPSTPVELVHSRFRPADRRAIQERALGDGWSGILVATQAIEAGVDLSSRALFTELAPWPSLVQRFGRCNRRGEHGAGVATVRWIDLDADEAAPYEPEALESARIRLGRLQDVGPASLETIDAEPGRPALPVLRRRDLLELFDTQPDLAGHDLDISRYIRASTDRDVQVAWRNLDGDAPAADAPELHRDELCSVRVEALAKLLGKNAHAYHWDSLLACWRETPRPVPGMTLLLDTADGGYDPRLGWTGERRDRPSPVDVPVLSPDADEAEPLSYACSSFVTLATHSGDVADELRALARTLGDVAPWGDLEHAARWHDLGKAHACFQAMLVSGLPAADKRRHEGGPWAKSDGTPSRRNERRHFRHELASALALLAQGGSDLHAYLVAAHHGKVRVSIRSRPAEPAAPDGRRFALGVWEGDVLPEVDLGDGVRSVETELRLDLMELGEGPAGPSWLGRTLALLGTHGPFRLAYWETLVRVADWRGTARHQAGSSKRSSS